MEPFEVVGVGEELVAWLVEPRFFGRVIIPASGFGLCLLTMTRTLLPALTAAAVMVALSTLLPPPLPSASVAGIDVWVMEGLLGAAWTWIIALPLVAVHWCGSIVDSAFLDVEGGALRDELGPMQWLLGSLVLALFCTLEGHLHFYRAWATLWTAAPWTPFALGMGADAIGLALIRSLEDGLLFALILSLATLVSGGWLVLVFAVIGRANPMLSLSLRQTALVHAGMLASVALALELMMDVWPGAYQEAHDAAETLVREVLP